MRRPHNAYQNLVRCDETAPTEAQRPNPRQQRVRTLMLDWGALLAQVESAVAANGACLTGSASSVAVALRVRTGGGSLAVEGASKEYACRDTRASCGWRRRWRFQPSCVGAQADAPPRAAAFCRTLVAVGSTPAPLRRGSPPAGRSKRPLGRELPGLRCSQNYLAVWQKRPPQKRPSKSECRAGALAAGAQNCNGQ